MQMEWMQALTIIGSILIPTLAGFGWMIHRMDAKFDKIDGELQDIKTRLTVVETVLGIFSGNFNLGMKAGTKLKTDP